MISHLNSFQYSPPCKQFTPMLISFYESVCKESNTEIILVSSDSTVEDFNGYFGIMPWKSLPATNSAAIKQKISDSLKIAGIPTLVVLDSNGDFISDTARNDVAAAGDDEVKQKALIQKWKETKAVPIAEAEFSSTGPQNIVIRGLLMLMKNPTYIIGLLYMFNKLMEKIKEMRADTGVENGGEL